ncbi:MAG: FkbM family methyltransferase [Planctomycetia bacterium]|jgi:FkbM family methyltransferase
MTSRLVKAIRHTFGQPAPRTPAAGPARREGNHVFVHHEYYGDLKLLANDTGISGWLFDGKVVWEQDIVELFARHFQPGRNVVDAGANLGLHSIALAKLARRGEHVYAFEPHPEIFPLAEYNCREYPQVRCINRAASDRASRFYMSSILDWDNAGGCGLSCDEQNGSYAVESVSIDSLGLDNVGLMKIDVEGHELDCIEGAAETIRRDKPTLIVEILGGHSLKTASPEIAAEIRTRINAICARGYTAEAVSSHDYLFLPTAA